MRRTLGFRRSYSGNYREKALSDESGYVKLYLLDSKILFSKTHNFLFNEN